MGGKNRLAKKIIAAFPSANTYDIYVEPFGGGASVLLQKPVGKHHEIYNDVNNDLVNFWKQSKEHAEEMQRRLDELPYSRQWYYDYHASLFDGTEMDEIERAVRWFYVLWCSFRPTIEKTPTGWRNGVVGRREQASNFKGLLQVHSYRRVIDFSDVKDRFRNVEIDCRDFAEVIKQYENPGGLRTLFFCDPPYIDAEHYYQGSFTLDDHKRLAQLLNETPAMVALSYYDHPLLDELYPESKWRRVAFDVPKHSQRTKSTHDRASEVLLCNYAPAASTLTLWDSIESA
jgi:DNA adenine methylase